MNETNRGRQPETLEVTDNAVLAQAFITDTLKSARLVQSRNYDTEQDAEAAKMRFLDRVHKNFSSHTDLADVDFKISGSGVRVPQVKSRQAMIEDASVGYEIFLHKSGVEPLDPVTTLDANIVDIIASVIQPPDESYRVKAFFIMQETTPQETSINIEGIPTPIANIFIFHRYLVECTNNSSIEVGELQERRLHKELVQDLAKNGLTRSAYGRKLNRLRSAFYSANEDGFTNLIDMGLLKTIGTLSDEYARKGLSQSDLMSRSLLDALGRDRLLQVNTIEVDGNMSIGTTITGRVVEVLMPDAPDDTFVPTVVLDVHDEGGDVMYAQVPISNIYELRF